MNPRTARVTTSTRPTSGPVVAVLMALALLGAAPAGSAVAAALDQAAPDFTLSSNGRRNLRLSEIRGQVVMLNFWASWCGPCRQEMPLLDALHQRYESLGFTLLGINVEQDATAARRYLEEVPVAFPILFDAANEVTRAYDVKAMPSTVLVDRDGRMRFLHQGYKPGDEAKYSKLVRQLLRE